MTITILDTITGEAGETEVSSIYEITEGNWSCDCNRNLWNVDDGRTDGLCAGPNRFLIIAVKARAEEWSGYEDFALRDANLDYPPALVDAFLPKVDNSTTVQIPYSTSP